MELQKRSFRRPSSLRTSWKSVWVACNGTAEEELPSPKQSENVVDVCLGCIFRRWRSAASVTQAVRNVVGVCLGGIRCSGSPRTSWVSVWVACNGAAGEELPSTKQSENVVEVCLGCIHQRWRSAASVAQAVRKCRGCLSGLHSLEVEECSIRRPGGPEMSWVSVWVAFVAQAVRERRGCLSGWPAMELQKRSFRRPTSLRSSWMSVWMAFTGGGGVQHPLHRRSRNVVGVCLGGIRCSGSPRTSWVSVWVACSGAAEEELPSTKQSENVVEVCLGGMQWNCRRGASVPQAV